MNIRRPHFDLSAGKSERAKKSRYARSKPFIRTMADDIASLSAYRDREWKLTKNGQEYCLGGWWHEIKCKNCKRTRYVYARVGLIFRNIDPDGSERYVYRAFNPSSTGHNPRTNALMPIDSMKPKIDCICLVEP